MFPGLNNNVALDNFAEYWCPGTPSVGFVTPAIVRLAIFTGVGFCMTDEPAPNGEDFVLCETESKFHTTDLLFGTIMFVCLSIFGPLLQY